LAETRDLVRRHGTEDLAARFGPLGLSVEVQGRIAAYQMSRCGVLFADGAREQLQKACLQRRQAVVSHLREDAGWKKILKRGRDGPRFDSKGYPAIDQNQLRACLEETGSFLLDLHGLPVHVPRTPADGRALCIHHAWRHLAVAHPMISSWVNLFDVCDLLSFLARGDRQIHPRYWTGDGVVSTHPGLETIRTLDLAGPLFTAREGSRFAVVRLPDLLLRALGRILGDLPCLSAVASILRQGGDPVREVVGRLRQVIAQRRAAAGCVTDATVSRVAPVLFAMIAAGHSLFSIRRRLNAERVALTEHQVNDLLSGIVNGVFLELQEYLRCPVIDRLASKMGLTPAEFEHYWEKRRGCPADAGEIGRSFFRNTGARHHNEAITNLFSVRDFPELSELMVTHSLARSFECLTAQDLIGPTGRVYRAAPIWDSFGKSHLRLAEVIRKKILYELVRAELRVCAYFDDTILIEVDSGVHDADARDRIQAVLEPVLSALLGDIPAGLVLTFADTVDMPSAPPHLP
jgi:hypothetical protein